VSVEYRRSSISFQDYLSLVDAVGRSWSRDGVGWLKSRFKQYRGHFGLIGNALLLHYASSVCVDAVPEPLIGSEPEVRADVTMAFREALLVLEVKVHHWGSRGWSPTSMPWRRSTASGSRGCTASTSAWCTSSRIGNLLT